MLIKWIQKLFLGSWLGRIVTLGLAAASGWLINQLGAPADLVADWVAASQKLIEAILPLLIAWLLGSARFNFALKQEPPK